MMKTLNSHHKLLSTLSAFLLCALTPHCAFGQTTIYSTNLVMIGVTNDTTFNIRADNNPIKWNGVFYRLPANGTNITTTNGIGIVQLVPGSYTVAYAGIPKAWRIYVTNSATAVNMADLSTSITFYTGVQSVTGAGSITVIGPTGAGGNVIISNNVVDTNALVHTTDDSTLHLNGEVNLEGTVKVPAIPNAVVGTDGSGFLIGLAVSSTFTTLMSGAPYQPASANLTSWSGISTNAYASQFDLAGAAATVQANLTALTLSTNGNPAYGYTNAAPMFFVVMDAGDANANGIYIQNAVASQWTNSTVAGYLLSSNATSPRWSLTNGSLAEAYHKTLAAIPNGTGLFTTDGGGTAPGPTVWRGQTAYPTNSFSQLFSTLPIYTPLNSNNITRAASVEMGGSDINGRPGFYPFASLNPLIQPLTSYSQSPTIFTNSSTIYVGSGSFTASNSVTSGPNGISIVGKGRTSSFITGGSTLGGNNSYGIQLGNSNYIKGVTFTGILSYNNGGGSGVGCTNWTIEDSDIIGDLDGIYITGTVGLYGLDMKNCRISSWWDCFYGVETAVISGCDFSSTWIGTNSLSGRNTNTAPQATFFGLTCIRMEVLGAAPCNYLINNCRFAISNGPTVGYSSATNAVIKIIDPNATAVMRNCTIDHYSSNASYAVLNIGGSTNVDCQFIDNGVWTRLIGTNYYKYGLVTTNTPVIADLFNAPGSVDWTSNGVRFITTSVNGSSVVTTKLAP